MLNRSISGIDSPHNLTVNGVAGLPFGKGRKWARSGRRGVASWILSGWQVNGILSAVSGSPFYVTASGTSLNAPGNAQRADQVKADVAMLGGAGRTNPGTSIH